MTKYQVADLVYKDNVHILIDLSGHTAFNRLDVFSLKPAPVQISYLGYPFTTGLQNMDYRITDRVCDDPVISQPFYSEKLLFMPNSFLCYDPNKKDTFKTPKLDVCPFVNSQVLTIGCFNRLNKITDEMIHYFNSIMIHFENVKFVFKTKALLNNKIKETFLKKFKHQNRVVILDCTILHEEHLEEYNKIDIAIDTWPYSGTTTSCEALYMGVPVFSLYDTKYYFHPQNVTVSILRNSHPDFEFYILQNTSQIFEKLQTLLDKDKSFWSSLKSETRQKFMNGKITDSLRYTKDFQTLLHSLV